MKYKFLHLLVCLVALQIGRAQDSEIAFIQYLDSTSKYIETDPELATTYLDSIAHPSEKNLGKEIGRYFYLRALIEADDFDPASSTNNFFKAVKYAEQFEDYKTAANASGEIASKLYLLKKDSLADVYFEKAKKYHTQNGDQYGLLDLMQFPAYAKYVNFEMQESIDLVLEDLETYKNVEDDQAYYSFAIFLLTSNYLHLGEIKEAYKYNSIYRSLEDNEYVEPSYYTTYENAINTCFAEYYFENENLDSVKHYLDNVHIKRGSKDFNIQKNVYDYYVKYYRLRGDVEKEKIYLDSLSLFNDKVMENTINSSMEGVETLSKTQLELDKERGVKEKNRIYIYVLIIGIVLLLVLLLRYLKKLKKKTFIVSDLEANVSSFKAKQEKLTVKNIELEDFLISLRKEIKEISTMNSLSEQKIRINDLYKKIHLNHSNFINSDDHLKVLSSINEAFFFKAEKDFPQLDDLEVLICYYLFTDFKNKEIATFVDRSVRALESKRYRITKKLNIDTSKETLKEFLDRTFKE